jgi:hypothetical protein
MLLLLPHQRMFYASRATGHRRLGSMFPTCWPVHDGVLVHVPCGRHLLFDVCAQLMLLGHAAGCQELPNYNAYPNSDYTGHDITISWRDWGSPEQYAAICDADCRCGGFNGLGYIKFTKFANFNIEAAPSMCFWRRTELRTCRCHDSAVLDAIKHNHAYCLSACVGIHATILGKAVVYTYVMCLVMVFLLVGCCKVLLSSTS